MYFLNDRVLRSVYLAGDLGASPPAWLVKRGSTTAFCPVWGGTSGQPTRRVLPLGHPLPGPGLAPWSVPGHPTLYLHSDVFPALWPFPGGLQEGDGHDCTPLCWSTPPHRVVGGRGPRNSEFPEGKADPPFIVSFWLLDGSVLCSKDTGSAGE